MNRRGVFLLVGAAFLGGGVLQLACGPSSSGAGFISETEGGMDSSLQPADSTAPMTDGGPNLVDSAPSPPPDSNPPLLEAGADGATDVPLANCSAVKGSCDIVSQNCGSGMECVAIEELDGGEGTQCTPVQASEHLDKGHACCPSATSNPCAPGLECIGDSCSDAAAAPPTGRCSPHCCFGPDGGDDTPCGQSDPEGYPGRCDLTIVDNSGNSLYSVCTYSTNCQPLHVQPCSPGYACEISDNAGTAACDQIFVPDGGPGLTENQSCSFGNECADGLMCLTSGDAGTCLLLCYVAGQATPFDAGLVKDGGPGYGGCPDAQACSAVDPALFPPWLGLCQ